ncbi:hypothetical protein HZH66_005505 [Vespula vulgaris]|uniref:Uncharacterized protein n=1 Tax=Vespula vulgaris TaxID=7454 RepID=A0A834KAG9_VESVU|nr:hypothetical protein HZH66_005505 [Vespula vulgaris]
MTCVPYVRSIDNLHLPSGTFDSVNHYVGGQNSKTTSSMRSTNSTTTSVVVATEDTNKSTETSGKDASKTVDIFQDILLDPSLVVARLYRDVNNEISTWSTPLIDVKDEHSSNVEEDLNTEEDRYYSIPYWYRRQDWQKKEERPAYKKESYRRFLKYPIFSGR